MLEVVFRSPVNRRLKGVRPIRDQVFKTKEPNWYKMPLVLKRGAFGHV